MKPIQKGMTTAVTRGELEAAEREGRAPVANVTQLTWFDTEKNKENIVGVLNGKILTWHNGGNYFSNTTSGDDIFALPEYEWQWVIQFVDGRFDLTFNWYKTKEEAQSNFAKTARVIEPYEPSKREVE